VDARPPAPRLAEVVRCMLEVLGNRHTWPPFLAFFFLYSAMGNLMLWGVPFLRDVYALSNTRAAAYASPVTLALLLSAPLTGYLSDRVFQLRKLPYTVLACCLFLAWVVLVLTLGTLPLWGLATLFFAMGLARGGFLLTLPIGREVNPPHLAGPGVPVANP